MASLNNAFAELRRPGRLTLGLMSPGPLEPGTMADLNTWLGIAEQADRLGFGALWVRDVPLMIPQRPDNQPISLDDPFLWLAALAGVTERIALGTAAAVLPLRHPLHLAKSALTLDRIARGRFVLGLGSGDRPEEFTAFDESLKQRGETFRRRWGVVRSALQPEPEERGLLREATGGYDVMNVPARQVPMLVVGSSRQHVLWIARHAEGWFTYYRDPAVQADRVNMWRRAVRQTVGEGSNRMLVVSMQLQLVDDPDEPAEPINLGLRCGRHALLDHLAETKNLGVDHLMLILVPTSRPTEDVVQELGEEVVPFV